jgi:C4-dicarboxylate transporter DctM subunit
MLMLAIYVMARASRTCRRKNGRVSSEILEGGKEAGWGLFLIIIIIGGIYGGVFTPTEAAAVAAVYSPSSSRCSFIATWAR